MRLNENFKRLDLLTGGIEKFLQGRGYLKLKSTGYMDLVIEKIAPNIISLAHYYQQNGDLVPDPDITVRINQKSQQAEAMTFQNLFMYQEVYPETNKVNLKLKRELNNHLSDWLHILNLQGFYG